MSNGPTKPPMNTYDLLYGLFSIAILGFAAYAFARRQRLPVKLKTCDELNALTATASWARQQIGPDDPRRIAIEIIWGSLWPATFPIGIRLSAKQLEILAPFIDEFIAGRGPSSILPAEYEDWRPEALRGFKARMQLEGLWPDDKNAHSVREKNKRN